MSDVIVDPDNPTQALVGDATDPFFGFHQGETVLGNIHDAEQCAGDYCIIHNPSDHSMRTWPLTWRDDKGVFERRCRHGVGHPDPDDAAYLIRCGREGATIHGCDFCCKDS